MSHNVKFKWLSYPNWVPLPIAACFFSEKIYNQGMEQVIRGFKSQVVSINKLVFLAVGLLFLGWLLNTPSGLLGKADAVAYAVCHRIDVRSFHLGERQIPLCARCTGMYLGAMLGLAYLGYTIRKRGGSPPCRVVAVLVVLVGGFVVDGLNSFASLIPAAPTLYEPQNWTRLLTGTGMGIVIAVVLLPAYNQTVWVNWDRRPAVSGLRTMLVLLTLALVMDLIVLSENPLVLYPLALISAVGVLVLLTLVYSMVWMIIFRAENRYESLRQMVLPLTAGFGLALLQIVVLDIGRYFFTGTWDGFHLG